MPPSKLFLATIMAVFVFPVIAVACTNGDLQPCTFGSDCNGVQHCVDGNWSVCSPDKNVCMPGSVEKCAPVFDGLPCPLVDGTRQCSECGDTWLECKAPAGVECCPGVTRECNETNECSGIQKCVDGNWGECTFEQVCKPFERRECTPIVNGVECPEITGKQKCNRCGSAWLDCTFPGRVKCCPGQTRACDGSGKQECTGEGRWGPCFDGDSCQGVSCPEGSVCSVPRCSMGKCILTTPKGCCTDDLNCASNQHCVDNNCTALECGDCFYASAHECKPKKHGVCCNGHWNSRYASCELDFNSVANLVGSVEDERSQYFLEKGISASKNGFLSRAEHYFELAKQAVSVFKSSSDYNEEVMKSIDAVFLSLESSVEGEKYSEFRQYSRQLKQLLRQKSIHITNTGILDLNNPVNEHGKKKPAGVPWLLVGLLAIALVFLVVLFVVEFKKRGGHFFFSWQEVK